MSANEVSITRFVLRCVYIYIYIYIFVLSLTIGVSNKTTTQLVFSIRSLEYIGIVKSKNFVGLQKDRSRKEWTRSSESNELQKYIGVLRNAEIHRAKYAKKRVNKKETQSCENITKKV